MVMDNLSSHKKAGMREAIEAADAKLLYLPPYGPDFSPIELAFSKFKWLLRTALHEWSKPFGTPAACSSTASQNTLPNYLRQCGHYYSNA
jgi:transposase